MYPFTTRNERDFMNLLSVYVDAAFFPLLRRLDFMQEGHRLEFTNPKGMLAIRARLLARTLCWQY